MLASLAIGSLTNLANLASYQYQQLVQIFESLNNVKKPIILSIYDHIVLVLLSRASAAISLNSKHDYIIRFASVGNFSQ